MEWTTKYLAISSPTQRSLLLTKKVSDKKQPAILKKALQQTKYKLPMNIIESANEKEEEVKVENPLGLVEVPNFTGLTMAKVRGVATRYGLAVKFVDHGIAIAQSIKPGTLLKPGDTVVVKFKMD
jgi:hypothetical protein